jgi:two-component system sensor histidine kinase BaeS
MRIRLLWKLVGSTIPVIAVVMLVVWLAIDYLAADYFMTLMHEYNISPTDAHRMFLAAVHRYLLWASLGALVCAVLVSFVLTRKILAPLSRMTEVTRQIAAGNYTARIRSGTRDEVGQLAEAFNRMTDSLQRIERLRRALVMDVAHELRTPLTNLRGYLEALRDGVATPCRETFELLHEETLRLVTLVEDMLRLAKAEAARSTLRRQRVVLQDVIEHALDMLQPHFVAKEITVDTSGTSAVEVILADPDKLAQAVWNLLQNAWQYTPSGGTVRITTERAPAGLTLTVINTGEGIPQADLPFIFERFYRGEKSRSRERGGAGIGLAIVKELVEAHGGQVGASSSATETRVWFTLPV